MQRADFWYNAEAEGAGAMPTGTRAGQFLFLSAQTPVDLETGSLIRTLDDLPSDGRKQVHHSIGVNAWYGAVRAQTWMIYQNLAKILEQQGSSLDNIIQQHIYLANIRDTSNMEHVMLSFFPDYKPTTMIIGTPNRGLQNGIRVWVDVIALVPESNGLQKEPVCIPELELVTAPYPQAVKVGQFLFFGEFMGIDPKSGYPATKLDKLGPDSAKIRKEWVHTDGSQERGKAQFWLIYRHFQKVLESQGATLKDLLEVTGFWRYGMAEASERELLRLELFKSADKAPPSTLFGINDLNVIREVDVITGGIALLPGKYHGEKGMPTNYSPVGTYAAWSKAGPFWFAAGAAGLDHIRKISVLSFADVTDEGRFHSQGRIDDSQYVMAKAWHAYKNRLFGGIPYKPSQVLHQTVYLTRPSDWPAVETVANIIYEGHIPPTTVVPVDDIALVYRDNPAYELVGPECIEIQLLGSTQ